MHRYPGIRSDSDLHTFGRRFKPWVGKPVATAEEIGKYMGEVIEENDLSENIRYRHRVVSAAWFSADNVWKIETINGETGESAHFTASFLWMCQGYYRHSEGFTPAWHDMDKYRGRIVHPQTWPEDFDYKQSSRAIAPWRRSERSNTSSRRAGVVATACICSPSAGRLLNSGNKVRILMNKGTYSGADVRLATLANGAITNADAQDKLRRTTYVEPTVDKVAPGIAVFGGSFVNLTLIEGTDGLIVYDTGEVLGDGECFLRQIRSISDKPIIAVIYSHSHYVHGTTALVGDGRGVKIIGHPRVNTNMATGGSGSLFAETAPLQISRTLQQFNHYAPESGPDAPAGAALHFGPSGFLPVDTPVANGERMTIAGIEMQFFTRYGSDTDDCLTVHLPQTGVVLNNLFWPWLPNIYTLRGSMFRDPREWRDGLKLIRDLCPAALVNTHARSVKGKEAVMATLNGVIDGLSAILDQTIRGILRGLGPDDLRAFVRLPTHLANLPNLAEIYGEISHFGPYLYNAALGWFDGDAATVNPLPPAEQATRLVEAMGGPMAVLSRAKEAFVGGELAWAAQLVGYLYRLDPTNRDVRLLKADVLQQMGRVTPAHTVRSWYVSQARALRGEVTIPRLAFANTRVLALAPPAESMDQYRIRIDPERSADLDMVVALSISDRAAHHAWHLRRGVVEFVADAGQCQRPPEVEIATDYDNWLRFFSCKRPLEEFLDKAMVTNGSRQQANAFFSAFDFYARAKNSTVST